MFPPPCFWGRITKILYCRNWNLVEEIDTAALKKLSALALARKAGGLALSKKGLEVKILKLKGLSSVCDYFVIASGEADVHVKAIAEAIDEGLVKEGYKPNHREGVTEGN